MNYPSNTAEYITTAELATLTHTKPQTWRRRRWTGDSPPYVKLGSRVLYRRADVEAWLDERTVTSTSAAGQAA